MSNTFLTIHFGLDILKNEKSCLLPVTDNFISRQSGVGIIRNFSRIESGRKQADKFRIEV